MFTVNRSLFKWILNPGKLFGGLPSGDFIPSETIIYYEEPIGGSTAIKRYVTNLDGINDHWLRASDWVTSTDCDVQISFTANDLTNQQFLVDGTGGAFQVFLAAGTGFINFPAGTTAELNGVSITNNTTAPEVGCINLLSIAETTASRNVTYFGSDNAASNTLDGAIVGIVLFDELSVANQFVYKISSNGTIELPLAEEDVTASSRITLVNADPSARQLITRIPDNSGFIGADAWTPATKIVDGNATAPTADSITINEPTTTLAGVNIATPVGVFYRVTGNCTLTSGEVDLSSQLNFSGVEGTISASGPFEFKFQSNGAIGFKRSFTAPGAVATITDILVEPVYDYAPGANP